MYMLDNILNIGKRSINKVSLKDPTGERHSTWLYTKRGQCVEIGATMKKSGTTRLQLQCPNHTSTLPPPENKIQPGFPWEPSFLETVRSIDLH